MYHKQKMWVKIMAFILAGMMVVGIITSVLFSLL